MHGNMGGGFSSRVFFALKGINESEYLMMSLL